MFDEIDHNRRRFLRNSAMSIAAAEFATIGSAMAQATEANQKNLAPIKAGTAISFASLKQIDAGLLTKCRICGSGRRKWFLR